MSRCRELRTSSAENRTVFQCLFEGCFYVLYMQGRSSCGEGDGHPTLVLPVYVQQVLEQDAPRDAIGSQVVDHQQEAPRSACSAFVLAAWSALFSLTGASWGGGSALRFTLPLIVRGRASTTGTVAGTMARIRRCARFRSIIPVDAFSVKLCTLLGDQPM